MLTGFSYGVVYKDKFQLGLGKRVRSGPCFEGSWVGKLRFVTPNQKPPSISFIPTCSTCSKGSCRDHGCPPPSRLINETASNACNLPLQPSGAFFVFFLGALGPVLFLWRNAVEVWDKRASLDIWQARKLENTYTYDGKYFNSLFLKQISTQRPRW